MKKQLHKLDALTAELGQTLTQTEKTHIKGGYFSWTCEEKRDANGNAVDVVVGYTFLGVSIRFFGM